MALNHTQKLKAATAAVAVAVVAGGVAAANAPIRICTAPNECRSYSTIEYRELKRDLAVKLDSHKTFTWKDHLLLIQVVNREMKGSDNVKLLNMKGENDVRDALSAILVK